MELSAVFNELKIILQQYEKYLDCRNNEPGEYYLDTKHIMKNKKPMFFGSVQIRNSYVSYHLMPVYVEPELLKGMSAKLKERMHGKSCFNFKNTDRALMEELKEITDAGYKYYKDQGYLWLQT